MAPFLKQEVIENAVINRLFLKLISHINKGKSLVVQIGNISLPEDIYIPMPDDGTIKKVQVTTANAITAASGTITLTDGDGNTMATVPITVNESGPGARFEDDTIDTTHGVVLEEEVLKMNVDGASSTVCKGTAVITYV